MKIPGSLTEQLRRLGYEAISRAQYEALMAAARVLISMDHDHDDDVHQNECPWCKSLAALSAALALQKRPQQIPPSNLIEGLSAIREALIYDLPLAEIDWMGYLEEAISRLRQMTPTPERIEAAAKAGYEEQRKFHREWPAWEALPRDSENSACHTWIRIMTAALALQKPSTESDVMGLIGEADREVFNEYFDRDKLNSLVKRLVAALRPLAQENESLTTERDPMMKCIIDLKAERAVIRNKTIEECAQYLIAAEMDYAEAYAEELRKLKSCLASK